MKAAPPLPRRRSRRTCSEASEILVAAEGSGERLGIRVLIDLGGERKSSGVGYIYIRRRWSSMGYGSCLGFGPAHNTGRWFSCRACLVVLKSY